MRNFAKYFLKNAKTAKSIAISGHLSPDYDSICSCLALQEILKQHSVIAELLIDKPLEGNFKILAGENEFHIECKQKHDMLVTLDSGSKSMLPEATLLSKESAKITFNIDHHKDNQNYMQHNFVSNGDSSCCQVLFELFEKYFELNELLATYFYVGIYADTGGFVYNNTNPRTFKVLAKLLEFGIDADAILLKYFRIKSRTSYELTRRALNSVKFYEDNQIAVSVLNFKDFIETKAVVGDSKFIVSYLPTIEGVKIAIAISEPEQHIYHVSLRTAYDYDVSVIAKNFGGGGHARASGCKPKGELDKIINKLIKLSKDQIGTNDRIFEYKQTQRHV